MGWCWVPWTGLCQEAGAAWWPEEQGCQQSWLEIVQCYLSQVGGHASMMVMGNPMGLQATALAGEGNGQLGVRRESARGKEN